MVTFDFNLWQGLANCNNPGVFHPDSRISHTFQCCVILIRAHLLLAWYLHEHTGHPKVLVNTLQEDENENFLEEAHVGAGHLQEDRIVGACYEGVTSSSSSETLPTFTGAIPRLHSWGRHLSSILEWSILTKDFHSLRRSPLTGTMATLPSQVYPKWPVTDVLL